MSDLHIDDFYRDAAKTLVLLYNSFPRQIALYVEDIAGPDTPDEFGLHSKRHESCLSTLLWLGNSDYLNYTSLIRREALEEACLSHRAFILLNSAYNSSENDRSDNDSANDSGENDSNIKSNKSKTDSPEGLEHSAPHGSASLLINRLRKELKHGSSDTLAVLVKQLMVLSRQV